MTTAANIVDRVYREWLHRPDDQPIRTTITADVGAGEATFPISLDGLTDEEQSRITIGTMVEVNQELVRVTSVDLSLSRFSGARRQLGTTDAAHSSGDELIVAPHFPRRVTFDAVADAIVDLYPDLWHTRTTTESLQREWVEVPAEATAVIRAMIEYGDDWVDVGSRFMKEFVNSRTGAAVIFPDYSTGTVLLQVKVRFTRPTAETTEITDIEPDWEQLVVLGAVVNLLGAADMDAVQQDFITETFQAQGFPPGSGERLSRAAIRLYEYKLDKAKRELSNRYPVPTTMSGLTYGGF